MNYKLVFHILGMILRVEAVLMVPAMIIGFATGGGDGTVQKRPVVRKGVKIGRNDPCPCGSGLKWKKCTCPEYHQN